MPGVLNSVQHDEPMNSLSLTSSEMSATYPLSSVQQAIWLDQALRPDIPCYNIGLVLEIHGVLDEELLLWALNEVTIANDSLRLVLHNSADGPIQQVLADVHVDLPRVDFSGHTDAGERARNYLQTAFSTPFKLYGGLLWGPLLVRESQSRSYLLLRFHHLIADETSLDIVINATADAYTRKLNGSFVRACGPSYLDFLKDDRDYLSSPRYLSDGQFWKERFTHLPPSLAAAPDMQTVCKKQPSGQVRWTIDRSVFERIKVFCAAYECGVPHFMAALLAVYFARVHRVDEVVIGIPVHNRRTAGRKNAVGMFSSVVPMGIDVDPEVSFADLLRSVAAELRRCYRHQ